jgi:hypothetical protein
VSEEIIDRNEFVGVQVRFLRGTAGRGAFLAKKPPILTRYKNATTMHCWRICDRPISTPYWCTISRTMAMSAVADTAPLQLNKDYSIRMVLLRLLKEGSDSELAILLHPSHVCMAHLGNSKQRPIGKLGAQ